MDCSVDSVSALCAALILCENLAEKAGIDGAGWNRSKGPKSLSDKIKRETRCKIMV